MFLGALSAEIWRLTEKNLNNNVINATTINAHYRTDRRFDFNIVIDKSSYMMSLVWSFTQISAANGNQKKAIIAVWQQIKLPYIKKLVDSMPNRIYKVIERRGKTTHH